MDLSGLVGRTIIGVIPDEDMQVVDGWCGVLLENGQVAVFTGHDANDITCTLVDADHFRDDVSLGKRAKAIHEKLIARHIAAHWVPPHCEEAHKITNNRRPRPDAIPSGCQSYIEMPDAEPWPQKTEDIAFMEHRFKWSFVNGIEAGQSYIDWYRDNVGDRQLK